MSRQKKQISKAEQWKQARPILVEVLLLLVDYILKKDEEMKHE